MAATREMVDIALKTRPHAACIVPERRQEVTTEGGLDVVRQHDHLAPIVAELKAAGIRVSLFIDADVRQIETAAAVGAPVIEIHTGAWCEAVVDGHAAIAAPSCERIKQGAARARRLGLEVHAGHGLDLQTAETIAALPEIVELNIGHFLIGEAIFGGLAEAVQAMRAAMDRGVARKAHDMIIGIGSDITDIRRIEKVIERHGERFLSRIFTDTERARAERRAKSVETYAKRFAAKEACAKALGTGLRAGRVVARHGRRQPAVRAPDDEAHRRRRGTARQAHAAGPRSAHRSDHHRRISAGAGLRDHFGGAGRLSDDVTATHALRHPAGAAALRGSGKTFIRSTGYGASPWRLSTCRDASALRCAHRP